MLYYECSSVRPIEILLLLVLKRAFHVKICSSNDKFSYYQANFVQNEICLVVRFAITRTPLYKVDKFIEISEFSQKRVSTADYMCWGNRVR